MAKNKTGLEWLLEKNEPPPAPRTPPPPDPAIPVPPPEVRPEPWQVKQVAEIRADVPARVLEIEPPSAPVGAVAPASVPVAPRKEGQERRAHPRAKVPMEVRFKKGSEAVVGKGIYLSLSGFSVESEKTLPPGEIFQAQLVFPEKANKRLAVIAEVINPTPDPQGMGAKFLDVDDSDLPFLKEVIEAALAAEKKA